MTSRLPASGGTMKSSKFLLRIGTSASSSLHHPGKTTKTLKRLLTSAPIISSETRSPDGASCLYRRQVTSVTEKDSKGLLFDQRYRNAARSLFSLEIHCRGLSCSAATKEASLRAGKFINLTMVEDEETVANAYTYCCRFLGGSWGRCSPDQFKVESLSGGMTNHLYLCSLDKSIERAPDEPRKVLIRIYGTIVDQKHIYKLLSEHGNGPRIFSTFPTGQIEEFYPHRTLSRKETGHTNISKLIARRTAEFHSMDIPVDPTPTFLWESMEKYLETCLHTSFDGGEENRLFESFKRELCFEAEYAWLQNLLRSLDSPVVFCHNDLHGGNMLYIDDHKRDPEGSTDIILIDFDYSSYNYRAYDIANHFCEWTFEYTVGGRDDDGFVHHPADYPSPAQQVCFAEEYIAVLKEKYSQQRQQLQRQQQPQQQLMISDDSHVDSLSVDVLLYEVDHFVLASHFLWFLWSIVQEKESNIDFAYMKYAEVRLREYTRKKRELGY